MLASHRLDRIVVACVGSLVAAVAVTTQVFAEEPRYEHLLFQAIRRGDVTLLRNVLRSGSNPDVRNSDGNTPLISAALHGTAEMVELLLEHGADPRAVNEAGVTALLWGAPDAEKVRLLLARGADPNARSSLGNTPLMVASASPHGAAAVERLLASGADITLRSKGGRTALRAAVSGGDVVTVGLLLHKARELGRLEQVVRAAGPTVAIAAGIGFPEIVDLLLAHGADANQANGTRGHGLNAALLAGESAIARTLIKHNSALDRRIQPGEVPTAVLATYTEVDDPSIVELLKLHGLDFSATNNDRETALSWARLRGHERLIGRLVEAGAPEGELPAKAAVQSRAIDLHAGSQTRLIAEAVQKSIDLLQLASDTFLDVRNNCVSCHHQNLPSVALAWGRDRGFAIKQPTLDRMIDRQVASWKPRIARSYELDTPFPVPGTFLGYGMWSFAELGYRPDELTRAVSWYLAAIQQPSGYWVPGMLRPPLGGASVQATALALRTLQLYPVPGQESRMADCIERARMWLERVEPRTHEDKVYRLLGLAWAGTPREQLADQVRSMLEAQRGDGGWAQLPGLESDAWATGQSLVALHVGGGLATEHSAYRRGVEMLLRTQFDDGSWYVQTRTWAFQPYFESNFPYGRDQWISAPATAWAVMALVLAVRPEDVTRLNLARASDSPPAIQRQASGGKDPAPLAATANRNVDFASEIRPILARSCVGCHGDRDAESNFSVTSRSSLLQGGDSDLPAVVPGDSRNSPLVRFAAGQVEKLEMPPIGAREKYPPLSAVEISALRAWIDQGATWPRASVVAVEK